MAKEPEVTKVDVGSVKGQSRMWEDLWANIESGRMEDRKITAQIKVLNGLRQLHFEMPMRAFSMMVRAANSEDDKIRGFASVIGARLLGVEALETAKK